MSIQNGYCTAAQVQAELGIGDNYDTLLIEQSIAAASRQIDGVCGRRFWQDSAVATRQYFADDTTCCFTDDISTTTGLIVAVDVDGDGTYETTLTITTDFFLLPANAADEVPVRPYTELRIAPSASQSFPIGTRPGVQVTAKFGWPAVPDDVTKACILQAAQLYKSKDAVFGAVSFGDAGAMRVRSAMNPIAAALVDAHALPSVA